MTPAPDASPEAVEHLAAALLSRRHENFVDHHISQESAALLRALSGDRDRLQAEVAALKERLEQMARLVGDYNVACQDLCGVGDQEAVRCGYRPYFVNSHRRCPECPVKDQIDIPEHLQPFVDAALARGGHD